MVRLFEFRDLDELTEIWLEGNLQAHSFVPESYWRGKEKSVRAMLPNAELYVWEEGGRIFGFIGMDAEYIAGLFVREKYRGQGIGRRLLEEAKSRKERLSLHVYRRNRRAVEFYEREGFSRKEDATDLATGEAESLMVWNDKESCI